MQKKRDGQTRLVAAHTLPRKWNFSKFFPPENKPFPSLKPYIFVFGATVWYARDVITTATRGFQQISKYHNEFTYLGALYTMLPETIAVLKRSCIIINGRRQWRANCLRRVLNGV